MSGGDYCYKILHRRAAHHTILMLVDAVTCTIRINERLFYCIQFNSSHYAGWRKKPNVI